MFSYIISYSISLYIFANAYNYMIITSDPLLLLSFTAKIGSEKHNGDEIDGRMLADRLLL